MSDTLTITSVIETSDQGVEQRSDTKRLMAGAELISYDDSDVPYVFFENLTDIPKKQILDLQSVLA